MGTSQIVNPLPAMRNAQHLINLALTSTSPGAPGHFLACATRVIDLVDERTHHASLVVKAAQAKLRLAHALLSPSPAPVKDLDRALCELETPAAHELHTVIGESRPRAQVAHALSALDVTATDSLEPLAPLLSAAARSRHQTARTSLDVMRFIWKRLVTHITTHALSFNTSDDPELKKLWDKFGQFSSLLHDVCSQSHTLAFAEAKLASLFTDALLQHVYMVRGGLNKNPSSILGAYENVQLWAAQLRGTSPLAKTLQALSSSLHTALSAGQLPSMDILTMLGLLVGLQPPAQARPGRVRFDVVTQVHQ